MPLLEDYDFGSGRVPVWHSAFKHALLKRLEADQLRPVITDLMQKHRAPGIEVARVLIRFRTARSGSDDPLMFSYARMLLSSEAVQTDNVLLALLETSNFMRPSNYQDTPVRGQGLPSCEERMFNLLTQMYLAGDLQVKSEEVRGLLWVLARWMHTVSEHETGQQLETGNLHSLNMLAFGMYEAIASLAITVLSSPALRDVSKVRWWRKRRPQVVTEMQNFDTHVLSWMGSQLAGRLRALSMLPPYMQTESDGRPMFDDQQILQSIPDLPVVASRAGLCMWLNACLSARPLTDDMTMLSFLQARYSRDNESIAIAILQATFDVLVNALLRKESEHETMVLRSFLCNKVPTLFTTLAGFMAPRAAIEACIQAAFESIPMNTEPPVSAGAAEGRDSLKLARREFLQACILQGLLSEQTASAILIEPSIPAPKATRYSREGLVAQCSNNLGRLEHIIEELTSMAGNAGAIAGCIVDVISSVCSNKDTMTLKSVCNILTKKVPLFDVIFQYIPPANLLLPLCTQLNDWAHDQEQTEFTPAYEEFASILLLILAVVHRYGLSHAEIGLAADANFVAQLLQNMAASSKATDLVPEQSIQLAKWVEGLYAVDDSDETNGISDEVMRQCPPQAFYQLVPTLFEQSVLACKSNALPMKLFKGGLELLLEPFLLPCLVGGFSWLVAHSWEDHGDADVLLQALDKLLRQNSASQEAKSMHKAILAIVADSLTHSLEVLIRRKPNQRTDKQINGLLEILKPYRERKRRVLCSKSELAERAASSSGGLMARMRETIQEQIIWTSNVGSTPPAKYTHRLFATTIKTIGLDAVLDVLVDELGDHTAVGSGPIALDVCSAIVCAPTAASASLLSALGGPSQPGDDQLTMRDALRLRTSNAQDLLKMPVGDAQALVRLHRRVEAQLAVSPLAQLPPMPIQAETSDQVMAELGLTEDNTLTSAAADMSINPQGALDPSTSANFTNADIEAALNQPLLDLGDGQPSNLPGLPTDPSGNQDQSRNFFADLNMDLSQPVPNPDGSNQNGDEDIFAGLNMDLGDDFDFS